MRRTLLCLTIILSLVVISSCSEIGEKKQVRRTGNLGSTCKVELDELSEFFEKNIVSKINCLEEQLLLAIKVLRNSQPGTLPLRELTDFLVKQPNIKDPEKTTKALKAVFELKYILLGGSKGHIKKDNLQKLFTFIREFNLEAVKIKFYLNNPDSFKYSYHNSAKSFVTNAAKRMSTKLNELFFANRDQRDKINISEFIEYFKNDSNAEKMEQIKTLIPVKRFIVGGRASEKNDFFYTDLKDLFDKVGPLMELVYDVSRGDRVTFEKEEKFLYLDNILTNAQKVMFFKANNPDPIFSITEIMDAAKAWIEKFDGDSNYTPLIQHVRGIINDKILSPTTAKGAAFCNSNPSQCNNFFGADFAKVIDYGKEMSAQGKFFSEMYEEFREHLDQTTRISLDMDRLFPPSKTVCRDTPSIPNCRYKKNFIRIAKDYRFFKGNFAAPYFISDPIHGELFKRNESAIAEIGIAEFAIEKALRYVEKAYPCGDSFLVTNMLKKIGMSNDPDQKARLEKKVKFCSEDNAATVTNLQISTFIFEIKDVLVDIGLLLPGREEKTGESVTLMSALFQYQANDNGMIDVTEATEFAISIFTTQSISKTIFDSVKDKCPNDIHYDDEDTPYILIGCYREHIIDVFRNEAFGKDHFPKFLSYYDLLPSQAEKDKLIEVVEMFTRPCKSDDDLLDVFDIDEDGNTTENFLPLASSIPMSKNDMIGIVAGIYNLETTFIRWDKNGNNLMDKDEVDLAFTVYDSAISGILDEMANAKNKKWIRDLVYGDFLKGLRKKIFYYLIKEGKAPAFGKMSDAPGATGFARFFNWIGALGKVVGDIVKGKTPVGERIDIAKILRTLAVTSKTPITKEFSCRKIFKRQGAVPN
jgi:hypothetical protein